MTSDRLSLFQQGRDRLAEGPIQAARSIFCAHVDLRPRRLQLRQADAGFDRDRRRQGRALGLSIGGKRSGKSRERIPV